MKVNQKQLAECFGLSVRRVQQLQADGIIHRDSDGYDLAECNQAYIEYKLDSETGRRKAVDKEAVQIEHERVKMEISKLKLKRLRRQSIDIRAVEECWTNALTYFRSKLDVFPEKAAFEIAGMDTNEAIATMDRMMQELIGELADYDPKDVDDAINDDDLYDDDDDDDEDDDDYDEDDDDYY